MAWPPFDEMVKSSASGVFAVIAACIAFWGVHRTITAENKRRGRAERLDAMVGAVEALEEALHGVRQRYIKYSRTTTDDVKNKWRDKAASRHSTLRAAGTRLQLLGMDRQLFEMASKAIDDYSGIAWDRASDKGVDASISKEQVDEQEKSARARIDAFSASLPTALERGRRAWRWVLLIVVTVVSLVVAIQLLHLGWSMLDRGSALCQPEESYGP